MSNKCIPQSKRSSSNHGNLPTVRSALWSNIYIGLWKASPPETHTAIICLFSHSGIITVVLFVVTEKRMVTSLSDTTEPNVVANLGEMAIQHYANPRSVMRARLSRHHSKSVLLIPVERK